MLYQQCFSPEAFFQIYKTYKNLILIIDYSVKNKL